ncbi:hypothetical protein Pcinc_002181, partial [Petrolisthes cinctipes]
DEYPTPDIELSPSQLSVTELDTEYDNEGEESTAVEYNPSMTQGEGDNMTPSSPTTTPTGTTTPATGGNNDHMTTTTSVGGNDRTTPVPNESTTNLANNNNETTNPNSPTQTSSVADNNTTTTTGSNQTTHPITTTTTPLTGATNTTNTTTTTVDGTNSTTTTTNTTTTTTTITPSTTNTTIAGGNGSNNTTDTNTTMAPVTPTTTTTTTVSPCGKNARISDDLCLDAERRGVSCPDDAQCYQMTCNTMGCNCSNHRVYEPVSMKCVDPCVYYGNSMCGIGQGFLCISMPSEPLGYSCTCKEGYKMEGDHCKDIDECALGGADRPCKENERCVNLPGGKPACPCLPGYLKNNTDFCVKEHCEKKNTTARRRTPLREEEHHCEKKNTTARRRTPLREEEHHCEKKNTTARRRTPPLRGEEHHHCEEKNTTTARRRTPPLRGEEHHHCEEKNTTTARRRTPPLRGEEHHHCEEKNTTTARRRTPPLRGEEHHHCEEKNTTTARRRTPPLRGEEHHHCEKKNTTTARRRTPPLREEEHHCEEENTTARRRTPLRGGEHHCEEEKNTARRRTLREEQQQKTPNLQSCHREFEIIIYNFPTSPIPTTTPSLTTTPLPTTQPSHHHAHPSHLHAQPSHLHHTTLSPPCTTLSPPPPCTTLSPPPPHTPLTTTTQPSHLHHTSLVTTHLSALPLPDVNECLNPSLHDCDQVCVDGLPPINYTCTCHEGFTWDNTTRRCVIDNSTRACNCSDAERSVCYKGEDGQKQCYPRPGYMKSGDDKFVDKKECGNKTEVGAWCWRNGMCVEGVGGSSCVCRQGYTNQTNNYGICESGTGSIQKTCTSTSCPPPLTCGFNALLIPECVCGIQCKDLMGSNLTSSVYQGTVLLHTASFNTSMASLLSNSTTLMASQKITQALGPYFGLENIEVVSVTPQTTSTTTRRKKREVMTSGQLLLVTFLVATQQRPNMTPQEVMRVVSSECMDVQDTKELCTLFGGLVVKKNSIAVTERDPCASQPCPSSANQVCEKTDEAPGRFHCSCVPGYSIVQVKGFMGYCQDVDECSVKEDLCEEEHVCINTPGSFVCRYNPGVTKAAAQTMREMAISFGILFFLTLFLTIGLLYLLMKKNKRERELVPMTTTTTTNPAYENDSYK